MKNHDTGTAKERFSIVRRLKSFANAFNGLKVLFREEHNARIHVAAAACVTVMGFMLKISAAEWVAVVLCFGSVIAMEAANAAVERLCDYMSPQKDERIRRVKDLAAAAVLIAAICSVAVGVIIFLPKIISLC